MGQPVAFFEVTSRDAERAQKFYAELFGWQIAADPAMGGYGLVDTGAGEGAIGGGSVGEPGEKNVKIYMRVDDPDAYSAGPRNWAGGGWSRRPTCPATSAGSPCSRTRTGTPSGSGAEPGMSSTRPRP